MFPVLLAIRNKAAIVEVFTDVLIAFVWISMSGLAGIHRIYML